MAELTYSQAFQQGMREEMERNDHIFAVGTDIYDRGTGAPWPRTPPRSSRLTTSSAR